MNPLSPNPNNLSGGLTPSRSDQTEKAAGQDEPPTQLRKIAEKAIADLSLAKTPQVREQVILRALEEACQLGIKSTIITHHLFKAGQEKAKLSPSPKVVAIINRRIIELTGVEMAEIIQAAIEAEYKAHREGYAAACKDIAESIKAEDTPEHCHHKQRKE